jgi:Holliday junction DNA helicase RuvA
MICALTGELRRVGEDRIELAVGPTLYELLVPAFDRGELHASLGQQMTLHTIFYLQGDAGGGAIEPRLIGFVRAADKRFFERFITVKGIGPRKALRALSVPVGEIASAIEAKDARALVKLPEIGKRTAEQIIAELAGKVTEFAAPLDRSAARAPARGLAHTAAEEDAIAALVALGERRPDAEHLLERAKSGGRLATNGADASPADTAPLVQEMLRLRGGAG